MYFEDIYNKLKKYWRESFNLDKVDDTETYVQDIMENYQEIEYIVNYIHKEDFTEWERMLAFTMYQALTVYAIDRWEKKKIKTFFIKEVPIEFFEHYFKKNLEETGNESFLIKYKGFKYPPTGAAL